ncbi:hypothetical protein QBC45DRAFT_327773 [Copromyces sp. CBS 386.78]|nr:hypothetical protein QBC45DRAFT_327773 [Copromyces sp. CBS 386.78]
MVQQFVLYITITKIKPSKDFITPTRQPPRSSINISLIVAALNWRVDGRRVKDEAIRMLRILTGEM